MKDLPIGIIDFNDLIKGNFIYVDKTKYIYEIVKRAKGYYFLSRPRRFGKSLMVSVLEYLFKGEKELFEGTWIYNKWNWESFPVVRLDVNKFNTETPELLKDAIDDEIISISSKYNIELKRSTYDGRFYELIEKLSEKYKKPVVLLIDEYEKPILDHISDKKQAHRMREILRQVYGRIKSLDQYLRFVFLTGITKYTKAGVFSTLNNLNDISLDSPYSQMLGYTLEEIKTYFPEYIQRACDELNMSEEYLFEQLEKHYGGFSFDGKHFVFNPFAVLLFFEKRELENFWHETAQPSFLYDYFKSRNVRIEDILERKTISRTELLSREIEDTTAVSFLVQAGYLTFKKKIDVGLYEIDFPNIDAGQSIAQIMLELEYGLSQGEMEDKGSELRRAIKEEKIEDMLKIIEELFSSMSYMSYGSIEKIEKVEKLESHYSQVMYALLFGAGVKCEMERETSTGRIDLWFTNNGVGYILELKVDKTPQEALEQIKEKRYDGICGLRKCYLIGINIKSKDRKIEWAYEEKIKFQDNH